MNKTATLKRKLLAIALTMVMAVSCLFGVLFIRANAAEIAISDLVTVSGDAIVKGVPQQYVMKNDGDDGTLAGTSVGDTGLYIESTKADSAGYTVALNGIFTGSTGMMLAFPGEGFWNGQMRSVIITVSSLSDPNETFDILFEGEWGMNATVAYEWESVPTISVDGSSIAVSPVGKELTLPVATYTTPVQSEPQTVTDISYKFDGEQSFTPVEGGKFTPENLGEYTVRYTVTAGEIEYYKDITFLAREFPESSLAASDLVSVSGATVQTATQYKGSATGTPIGEQGMLFTAQDPTQNYTVDVVGVFTGSTTLEWAAPGENWDVVGMVTFTIAELGNPENSFQVIWTGPNQTSVYVKYNYPGKDGVGAQELVRASNGDYTSYKMGTSHNKEEGQVGDNWFLKCKPFLNNWNDSNQRAPGILRLHVRNGYQDGRDRNDGARVRRTRSG